MGHTSLFRLHFGLGLGGLRLLALSGIALSSLVGCGGGDDEEAGQKPGTTATVDQVEADGFLLTMVDGSLALLDPETGKVSADELDLSREPNPSNHFSVSPNGRQIAFVSSSGSLKIADITYEGGAPGFQIVRELVGAGNTRPRYTPDGLRILTLNAAIDPATGESWPCLEQPMRYPLVPLPGGHRYICSESQELKEDGDILASEVGAEVVTADGQFANVGVHVPSGSVRNLENWLFDDAFRFARTPLADGRFASLPGSGRGQAVSEESGGFVTLYTRVDIDVPQRDGLTYDITAPFESGDWMDAEVGAWPLKGAGFPGLSEGDGASSKLIGVSQDAEHALFWSSAWKIDQDQYTNALYQNTIESALSVVDREGKVETFRTTTLGDVALYYPNAADVEGAVLFQPELFQDTQVVDFGDGNLLTPVTGNGQSGVGWGGYYAGKPYVVQNVGRMSRDGKWFVGKGEALSATDLRLCFTKVGTSTKQCLKTSLGGEPQTIVGYGMKSAHAKDAPEILATSRSAAWPGSTVSVFGVRFGDSGTLHVGDSDVADADIVSWSDDHIEFTVSEDLPASGQIVVETAQGKGGTARQFWLHQTRLAKTPFDGLRAGTIPLGQGLNVVDVGEYEPSATGDGMFSSRTRLDSGEFVLFSEGAPEPMLNEVELESGGFTHKLFFQLENRLADDKKWQLITRGLSVDPTNQYPTFRTIAGDLVEYSMGYHPVVGERILPATFATRIPSTVAANFGPPDYWRNGADGKSALVINKVDNVNKALSQVLNWNAQPDWGTPTFAPSPRLGLSQFMHGVEAAGQVMILTGWDTMGSGKAAFQLSTDGGATFGAATLVDEVLGNPASRLLEPIRIEAKAGTFFLVLESLGGNDVAGVHAISTAGAITKGIAEVPSGVQLPAGLAPASGKLDYVSTGGKLLIHFPLSHTLLSTDFDAAGDAPKAWTVLPSAADAQHVLNIWQDPETSLVYAVKDDGAVVSAPGDAFDDPAAWEEVDLGIELALPTIVTPLAVSRLEDGRWFVLADMNDAKAPAEISPFGTTGFLLGPKP